MLLIGDNCLKMLPNRRQLDKHQNKVKNQNFGTLHGKKTLRPGTLHLTKPFVRTQFFSSRDAGSGVRKIPDVAYTIYIVGHRSPDTVVYNSSKDLERYRSLVFQNQLAGAQLDRANSIHIL